MIQGIPQFKGPSSAKVLCDTCARPEIVCCSYLKGTPQRPNEGQIIKRMTRNGWSSVKGILRCPTCEAERKKKADKPKWLAAAEDHIKQEARVNSITKTQTKAATEAQALRKPTPDQELDIIEALLTCYDRKAKRYIGADTDKTVAEDIGGGILPGWVAEIREAKFGPSGGNEEIDRIRAEIAKMVSKAAADRDAAKAAADTRHAAIIEAAQALDKRISAICAAVGPRAARA